MSTLTTALKHLGLTAAQAATMESNIKADTGTPVPSSHAARYHQMWLAGWGIPFAQAAKAAGALTTNASNPGGTMTLPQTNYADQLQANGFSRSTAVRLALALASGTN